MKNHENHGQVHLSKDAFLTGAAHALSNDKEEIIGLLLGDIEVRLHQIDSIHLMILPLRFYFIFGGFFLLSIAHGMCCSFCSSNGQMQRTEHSHIAHILGISFLIRSDRRPDRVEVSPQQMILGQETAEVCSKDYCYFYLFFWGEGTFLR
jgi:hypothetical protein